MAAENQGEFRTLAPGQRCVLKVGSVDGPAKTVYESTETLFEAPNWTPDGRWLVFNAGGRLFRLAADGTSEPSAIDTGSVVRLNNDHLLSPDGATVYASNNDGHLYALPLTGGQPRRVSNDHDPARGFRYYLHGISPDGLTLVYVGLEKKPGGLSWDLWTIPSAGGPDTRLTTLDCPCDGPEFSPDGQWLYYNSEEEATRPGHSQIFRRHLATGKREQLTLDERVNWFPHPSPDGRQIVYLSYPAGTEGHPADKAVTLTLMAADGGPFRELAAFQGGQGTINVNSWAPDSRRLAWVEYPQE